MSFLFSPISAALALACDFQSHFSALSSPSAHFLCVTAPFPVSVEAIRKITATTHNPVFPLVSFSIFVPARLFPPFSALLFFLACSSPPGLCLYLIPKTFFNHVKVIKRQSDQITMKATRYLPDCCGPLVYTLHFGPHPPFTEVNHPTARKTRHWLLFGAFLS